MLRRFVFLVIAASCTLAAQSTCPQPNFLRPQPFNLKPSSTSHIDAVRQPDGSYTGFEVTDAAPYRTIATTPHLERQLAACLGHAIPAKPALTAFSPNPPGAGSQLQVSEALSGGGYFVGTVSYASTVILFDIFDSQHNLLSETSFTGPPGPAPFYNPNEFFSLLLADVNSDGIPDLLAVYEQELPGASARNGGVWTFLGNGDGTFRPGTPSVLTNRGILVPALTAAVGDLNGDGQPDLVLAAPNGGPVLVAAGNGDGTFNSASQVLYPLGSGSQATVVLADLNGDGKLDIVASGGGTVDVLLGNGDGTFQPQVVYSALPPFGPLDDTSWANLAIGDVNGDGHLDIVTSTGTILFGDGKGAFPQRRDYSVYTPAGPASVMLADFDGDGYIDLIFGNGNPEFLSGNATDPDVTVLFGTGGGKFNGAPTVFTPINTGPEIAADFTGDGIPDVAVVTLSAAPQFSVLTVLRGVGDGTFQAATASQPLNIRSPFSAVSADFNRDGKPDLAIVSFGPLLTILLGNGDGTFGPPLASVALPDPLVSYLLMPDLNGDGIPDLIAAGQGNMYALLGKGDGTFSAVTATIPAANPAVALADFNGDGKPDLAFANSGASTMSVLPGKGDGTFGTPIVTTLPSPALGQQANLVAADFNSDGHPDIALTLTAADDAISQVAVFPGRGDGTFGRPSLTAALIDLTAVDVNGDGVIDLLGGNGGQGVVGCLGNGDETFQPCTAISGPFAAYLVSDFNRDGLPDVAVSPGATLTTYLNLSRPVAPLTVVSAASFLASPLAPGSFAAAFGAELPVSGTTVEVQDSAGTTRSAQIYYASSTQVNFVIPAGTAPGAALVTVSEGLFAARGPASIAISPIAPALFSVGSQIAAAYTVQSGVIGPVFQSQSGTIVAVPVDVSHGGVYLVLFGTGFDAAIAGATTVSVQGIVLPVSYAGVQPSYAGLDQINIALPPSLAGTGVASVSVSVAGRTSNVVYVDIR